MRAINNSIIARFMGGLTEPFELPQHGTIRPNGDFKTEFTIEQLKYHKSWDWLMPVVEKIESLGYEFIIIESRCKINNNTDHSIEELFYIETIGSKINATYEAVVAFINEYNKCNHE